MKSADCNKKASWDDLALHNQIMNKFPQEIKQLIPVKREIKIELLKSDLFTMTTKLNVFISQSSSLN